MDFYITDGDDFCCQIVANKKLRSSRTMENDYYVIWQESISSDSCSVTLQRKKWLKYQNNNSESNNSNNVNNNWSNTWQQRQQQQQRQQ